MANETRSVRTRHSTRDKLDGVVVSIKESLPERIAARVTVERVGDAIKIKKRR